jgi:hypothetical protein
MITTHHFGHEIYYDADLEEWFFLDNDEPVTKKRPCPQCGEYETSEGYDPCIGKIKGAVSVCCGHGVHDGFIVWPNTIAEELEYTWLEKFISAICDLLGLSVEAKEVDGSQTQEDKDD